MKTLHGRELDVEDWLKMFDAVIRLKPEDVPAKETIDHSFAIRDAAKRAIDRLREECRTASKSAVSSH